VRLDGSRLVKQAVTEDEMFSACDADDPAYGAHLAAAMEAMMQSEMIDAMMA
jgi:hypothetical protein